MMISLNIGTAVHDILSDIPSDGGLRCSLYSVDAIVQKKTGERVKVMVVVATGR